MDQPIVAADLPPPTPEEKTVNVLNPEGKLVSIPQGQLSQARNAGYHEATEHDENVYRMEEKYGGIGQQAITALEGAGSAATLGLSTKAEIALGVDPADIMGRREANPTAHMMGAGAGLLASSALIPGGGVAGIMENAGSKAAGALGLGAEGAGLASRIGGSAVQGAVGNALFQGGDEASKLFTADPRQTAETALSNIGLSAVIGGGLSGLVGASGEVWKSKVGPKLEELLNKAKEPGFTQDVLGHVPDAVVGAGESAAGFVPGGKLLLKGISKYVGEDVGDVARASLSKFLGTAGEVDAAGFKSMVDYIQQTIKGDNLISRATKNVFAAGEPVIGTPTARQLDELDNRLKDLQNNPDALAAIGAGPGTYMPEHGTAIASTTLQAITALNAMRPTPEKAAPLDADPTVSKPVQEAFQRALSTAQQPLQVLTRIKNGTLLPQDVGLVKQLYPALYQKMSDSLMNELLESSHKGSKLSYQSKIGLSHFLGQPLDSTMMPKSIMAAQAAMGLSSKPPAMAGQQGGGGGGHKGSMKALQGFGNDSMTISQARVSAKQNRR